MTAQVSPRPSAEKLIIEILAAEYAGMGYSIATVSPDDLPAVAIVVDTITGGDLNIRIDLPVMQIGVITSKHISGDAGYGIADTISRDIWAVLWNSRGQQFDNGIISMVKTMSTGHRVSDTNVDVFRFVATYQLTIHA